MRRAPDRSPATDRGAALLIAVAALALVALLGAALLANAQAEVRRAERLVDRTEGDQLIEIAVAEAWAEIVAGATREFTDSGTATGGRWSLVATPGDERWTVRIDARTDDDRIAGQIIVSREPLSPYTLVVNDAKTGPLSGLVEGRVGIRGEATFAGRSLGDVQELIGPSAQCNGCSNPIEVEPTDIAIAPPELPKAPCPAVDGAITGKLAGGYDYICASPRSIVITGEVAADGQVTLSFGADVELVLEGAVVNVGGSPADFFIRTDSRSDAAVTARKSEFHGILTGSDGGLRTDGLRWEGTIAVGTLRSADGSELTGRWSDDLVALGFGGWRITEWRTTRP
ncbi:MAG: hypothetical protein R2707_14590 [Acidimicrobiales bacterium]